jgi:hypothetical protein
MSLLIAHAASGTRVSSSRSVDDGGGERPGVTRTNRGLKRNFIHASRKGGA